MKENPDRKKKRKKENTIILTVDVMTKMQNENRKTIITPKGYKKYQQILQHKEISKIMQTANLQHQCDLWSQAIEDTIKKVEKITKKSMQGKM